MTGLLAPLTIENVTGAGGTIGVGRVARALPDGYTIAMGISSTHVRERRNLQSALRRGEGFRADRFTRLPREERMGSAKMRPTVSIGPPAGNGTTMVIGRAG
ncbi:MAG TPA: tripartite tricarboxylate transporter substrate-binding protein [Xanthobacteraceae bacterium]|nr:tripartite tricarboxylate transporter substrate-binding protein [Xanthobacteraceae bacterium]